MKTRSTKKLDKVIIIGTSAGGIHALKQLVNPLTRKFPYPVVIIIHRLKNVKSHLIEVLQTFTPLTVKEAEEKEYIKPGVIYVAPSNYHLLLETNNTFSLSVDDAVNFSRPSIDVSLISFSDVLKHRALGIILTGANADGAYGLQVLHQNGGEAWVQNPEEAYVSSMPEKALELVPDAKRMSILEMSKILNGFTLNP